MSKIFNKLKFIFKKPKIVVVTGNGRQTAREVIYQVLKQFFQIGREVLIFETDLKKNTDLDEFKFFIKKSSLPILVVTHVGEIPPDKDFFAGEKEETNQIRKLAKVLPVYGFLILNFDDETVREIKDYNPYSESKIRTGRLAEGENRPPTAPSHTLTFGFQTGADFRVSDINLNLEGTNFKINYKGNIVPVWLDKLFGKEQIYSVLVAASVGVVLDINLVEISQALRSYKSLPGKMRLIEGIKNSWILDDSENATPFSMIEALEILGKIETGGRKIAVLGDILGIGKYTIEAHETIGEKVGKVANLLFTFGARARFIAQGAINKGMPLDKIFQFDKLEEGKIKLQDEIKKGDLILVDGSKEMKMGEIIREIKGKEA